MGSSPGNGHPYSWSAIFNGYDPAIMAGCPYPTIPEYLSRQRFPEDAIAEAAVTHIWTQDRANAAHIAAASRIPTIVHAPEAMLGAIDGLLLARDDAERHREMAAPFLAAGVPVYIDKPLALSVAEAEAIYALEARPGLVFTGSALGFAPELKLTAVEAAQIGPIKTIEATTPKSWDTYAIHMIDPLVALCAGEGPILSHQAHGASPRHLDIAWSSGVAARVSALGDPTAAFQMRITGANGAVDKRFCDTFGAFKAALQAFIDIVSGRRPPQDRSAILAAIRLLEAGRDTR